MALASSARNFSLLGVALFLVVQFAVMIQVAEAAPPEVESLDQVPDVPSWMHEELKLFPDRGVYAFMRFYEDLARNNESSCNRMKLSVLDPLLQNLTTVFERQFSAQMDAALRSASLLSSLFQTRLLEIRASNGDTVRLTNGCGSLCDDAYYYTVARSFVEGDERVLGFGIAFALDEYVKEDKSYSSGSATYGTRLREFYPYAHRNVSNRRHILLKELSRNIRYVPAPGQYSGTDWFNDVAPPRRNYDELFRRTNQSDVIVQSLGEPANKVKAGAIVFATRNEARWSVPYFDCKITSVWKTTYSVPFFDANQKFKGVVTLDVALDDVDIDQCASAVDYPLFGGTHKCKQETTDCVPIPGRGFRLGMYECRCRAGFYFKASSQLVSDADPLALATSAPPTLSSLTTANTTTPLSTATSEVFARKRRQAAFSEQPEPDTSDSYQGVEEDQLSNDMRDAYTNASGSQPEVPLSRLGAKSSQDTNVVPVTVTVYESTTRSTGEDSSMSTSRALSDMYMEAAKASLEPNGQLDLDVDVILKANENSNFFPGWLVEYAFSRRRYAYRTGRSGVADYDVTFQCLPCKVGCDVCVDDTPCLAESNMLLRGLPLAFQSFFVTICCLIAVLVFRLRKTKLMRSSTWLLQELILLGGVLIYFTIFVMYFEASLTTCMTQPWFRQIGFALVYGSILLRLYRILVEHQSRNARRVHLADRDMLKYVIAIVAITAGYMLIWTSVNVDQFSTAKLLQIGSDGVSKYLVCKACWWDYLVELGELLFVSVCIYLCYCARSCPAEYGEVRLITAAVCNEALLSGIFHLSRHFFWLTAHPDVLFLAYFVHCHLTITVTLCLIVGSRVWFAHVQAATAACGRGSAGSAGALLQSSHTNAARTASNTLSPAGPSSNGELDNGDANLSEMDADEVRAELRRVYMQLQIYKHKAMRKDNPHINKRGKAGKDRRCSGDPGGLSSKRGVASRTPEDSTASNDRGGAD